MSVHWTESEGFILFLRAQASVEGLRTSSGGQGLGQSRRLMLALRTVGLNERRTGKQLISATVSTVTERPPARWQVIATTSVLVPPRQDALWEAVARQAILGGAVIVPILQLGKLRVTKPGVLRLGLRVTQGLLVPGLEPFAS